MAAATSLAKYHEKRDFKRTAEPRGKKLAKAGFSYVIQKHAARRLHYDFRLELDGVLLSWAVPKGPNLDPDVKRLAVQTEDHPVEYGGFEGIIPEGEYGGGTVMIWDRGSWEPEGDPRAAYAKGHIAFTLHGERLQGKWHLVRTKGGEKGKSNWLLFKGTDALASKPGELLVESATTSVVTRRTLEQIAKDKKSRVHAQDPEHAHRDGKRRPAAKAPEPRAAAPIEGARRAKAPKSVEVEKATLSDDVPDGDDWFHEIKLDGYRVVAFVRGDAVELATRNGKDFTGRAPNLAEELARLGVGEAILDGEVVALREDGISDFQLLQNALSTDSQTELLYFVFDLLYLDGQDLRGAPLETRKEALRELLGGRRLERVRLSDHVVGGGPGFFEKACAAGLEGIVSKRRAATYQGARTRDWLKIKCSRRQEFVIGGFTEPSGSRSDLGALLVGVFEDGALKYSGKVGTGFTQRSLRDLRARLAPLERDEPAFENPPKGAEARGVHWVEPKCVAEVEFTEFTGDGRLRHPTFRGLREDKPAREVHREHAAPAPRAKPGKRPAKRAAAAEPALPEGFSLSNPERVFYPEAGITKRDLALYYASIAEVMLPHVVNRPLTLVRCPQGHQKQCFFQKHAQKGQPGAIRIVKIEDEGGLEDYTYIDDLEGLVSLAQMGVLEVHTWGSHVPDYEKPDLMVFDLDPDPSVAWERVVEAALLVKHLFERIELESFVKTTGGKGLHVCVPFRSRLGWDEVKSFCQAVAEALVAHAPDRYVATMSKRERKGKIFIDYLRNGRGATFIAPYSTRARPGAPVAVPVAWSELPDVRGDAFTLKSLPERMARLERDPWEHMNRVKQTLALSRLKAFSAKKNGKGGP